MKLFNRKANTRYAAAVKIQVFIFFKLPVRCVSVYVTRFQSSIENFFKAWWRGNWCRRKFIEVYKANKLPILQGTIRKKQLRTVMDRVDEAMANLSSQHLYRHAWATDVLRMLCTFVQSTLNNIPKRLSIDNICRLSKMFDVCNPQDFRVL